MTIVNLTRKVLPKISAIPQKNIDSVRSMPEMVLSRMINDGAKNIVHCDMNQSIAAIIAPDKINTIYTDALNGCNAVNIIARMNDKKSFVSIMSHYVPTNTDGQISAIDKSLKSLGTELLKNHLSTCVVEDIKNDKLEVIDEIVSLFEKMNR